MSSTDAPARSDPTRGAANEAKRRVLFVDDEAMILQGLRVMLRRERRRWDMDFAMSGAQALSMMGDQPYDVVITDMRMPEMDGAQLLEHVQQMHPETVRIVLSGFAETEASLRALPVAHQFVTKPCTAAQLREVVVRASALHTILEDPKLRRAIGGMNRLPTLSDTYVRLSAAIADPDSGAREVSAILENDVGAAAKVLQLVNSGFFGLEREVRNIQRAVSYLGFDVVRSLVMLNDTMEGFSHLQKKSRARMAQLQRHSLLTGLLAREMFTDRAMSDDAFTVGLLHDIGKMVLATIRQEGRVSEASDLGHAAAGAYLLGLWGLPLVVVEAVAMHHRPWKAGRSTFGLPAAAHIADALAHVCMPERKAPGPVLNTGYLDKIDVLDRMGGWEERAGEIAEQIRNGG